MLNKVLGGIAGVAFSAAAAFIVGALQSEGDLSKMLWLGFVISLVIAVAAAAAWLVTGRDRSDAGVKTTVDHGGIANAQSASTISQTASPHGTNINIATIYFHLPGETDSQPTSIPILDFSDPLADDQVAIVDAQFRPHTMVRIWRVELRNLTEGTEATDVEVVIARSIPPLATFPVDLHKFHDDNAPYAQHHTVRHNAPITFDVIAKHQHADEFFLWRSDLPHPPYTFIYQLSPPERATLFAKEEGAVLVLRAAGNAPVKTKEKAYRVFVNTTGEFIMETVQPEL